MKKTLMTSCLIFSILLVGCGDSELTRRNALIDFLSIKVITSNGLPIVSDEIAQREFGDYAKDYQLITHYALQLKNIDESLNKQTVKLKNLKILSELVNIDSLVLLDNMLKVLELEKSTLIELNRVVNTDKEKLVHPDTLRIVFNQAYEKNVTQKQNIRLESFDATISTLLDVKNMIAFLLDNKSAYIINGQVFEFTDQNLLNTFNENIKKTNKSRENLSTIMNKW